MRFLFLFLFLVGCGRDDTVPSNITAELEQMYRGKLEQLKEVTAEHVAGWPSDHDCDGALWAGIARAAGAEWVDMAAALQPDGRPTRRPFVDCSVPDESAATTSNDMITGIILGLQAAKDVDSLSHLYRYGESHSWVMGYPERFVSRTVLRPNGITLLARVLYHLTGGEKDYSVRLLPMIYGPVAGDYQLHLILLSRLASKRAGNLQSAVEIVETIAAASAPNDALAQAVAGNKVAATVLLLNPNYQPPSYVRGHPNYRLVHWLLAARVTLDKSTVP